jgi:hypothetical protein
VLFTYFASLCRRSVSNRRTRFSLATLIKVLRFAQVRHRGGRRLRPEVSSSHRPLCHQGGAIRRALRLHPVGPHPDESQLRRSGFKLIDI